ncbi:MAG TPA: hypothetical protein VGL29_20900 [Blastocatellia bacterium]
MRKRISIIFAALLVLGVSALSMAGPRGEINRREYREQKRINQGIRSGELTRREADRLEEGLAKIKTDERYAKKDGNLGHRERVRLNRELNHESREIYRYKRNR